MDKQNKTYSYKGILSNKNEALIHTTMEINLENIMLRETRQTQKAINYTISLISNVQNRHRNRKQFRGCQRLGEGEGGTDC